MSFLGKTVFISGSTRGIGKATALAFAKLGANIVITGKTVQKHHKLPGTIYDAADEVHNAGGAVVAIEMDITNDEMVEKAVRKAVNHFGGIDILINNASAISLTGTAETPMKKFDLMHKCNVRGTYMLTKLCLPHLKAGRNPHILNYSPPLLMNSKWFCNHTAYTMSKYGMSMCVLGMAEEFKPFGIACNALWPKTAIATDAIKMLSGDSNDIMDKCRKPTIMADAAVRVVSKPSNEFTGNFLIDELFFNDEGIENLDSYAVKEGTTKFLMDFFVPEFEEENQTDSVNEEIKTSDLEDLFIFIKQELEDGSYSEATEKSIKFKIKNQDKNEFWLITPKENSIVKTDEHSKANIIISATSQKLIKLFYGQIDPMLGFLAGDFKFKGDLADSKVLRNLLTKFSQSLNK